MQLQQTAMMTGGLKNIYKQTQLSPHATKHFEFKWSTYKENTSKGKANSGTSDAWNKQR